MSADLRRETGPGSWFIAGGEYAIQHAVEGAEDSREVVLMI